MNSILNKNLKLFQNRFPALYNIFVNQITEFQKNGTNIYQIATAKSGDLTATETLSDGTVLHLHSAYNPKREAETFFKSSLESIQKYSTSVFYGFGLGYHVIEWAKLYSSTNKKLVLLESDIMHFLSSISILDWEKVFEIENLIIAVACPSESVLSLLENPEKINLGNEGVSDTFFFDIPSFTKHDESYFSTVKEIVKRNQKKNEINAATLNKFGNLWTRNTQINKQYLGKLDGIEEFNGCFGEDDNKFIVVGAGPTLHHITFKIQEFLNTYKNKVKIICVETALHHLLRNNITPDFIIITDPQYWAYKHLCGLESKESILITDISVYPSVFRFNCKEIRLMKAQFPLAIEYEKKEGLSLVDLGTGGSVASVAFNFAIFTGCKNIYLAGIDFSFPEKQTHVKGSCAEQTFHTKSNHLATSENFTANSMFSANPQTAVNYNGDAVITDSRMKMFAWWFEARIASLKDVNVYTLSNKAMKIPSVKYIY